MRTVKILFPIIFSLTLTFGLVGGLALASGVIDAINTPPPPILYVDADAAGASTGSSWEDAYPNLQDALTVAVSGTEIWVAEGVYYPDEGVGQINDVVSSTFVLTDGVTLYGGFAATETLRTQRNWEANLTVLSGDIDENDLTDLHGVVTDTANINGNNAYHVVSSFGVTITAAIDGFSITAGRANGSYSGSRGGGMYNNQSSPMLSNVTFAGNSARYGGGIYNNSSNPTLTDVIFSGNSAETFGGGMCNEYPSSSPPRLTNVTFSSNSAKNGGGMFNYSSSPTLTNVTFANNSVSECGGGMCNDSSSPTLAGVTFIGNSAGSGGGMCNGNGSPRLTNVTFVGNSADTHGGAISSGGLYYNDTVLVNVTFSSNSAGESGGAIYNAVGFFGDTNSSLSNVILWGNTAVISDSQIFNVDAYITITNSLVQGGLLGGIGGSGTVTDGGGNIDTNPLFVRNPNPGGNDFGDLHLQPGSPAIDTGTNVGCPATDLDGYPRPVNGICDMGAYEFTHRVRRVYLPLVVR